MYIHIHIRIYPSVAVFFLMACVARVHHTYVYIGKRKNDKLIKKHTREIEGGKNAS